MWCQKWCDLSDCQFFLLIEQFIVVIYSIPRCEVRSTIRLDNPIKTPKFYDKIDYHRKMRK